MMQALKLLIASRAESGSVHAVLEIDGNNTGALYLTSDELKIFTNIINSGAHSNEVSFSVEDSLDCNQEIDDDPWDD